MFVRHSWSVSTGVENEFYEVGFDLIRSKLFFAKLVKLCLLRFSVGQDMLTQRRYVSELKQPSCWRSWSRLHQKSCLRCDVKIPSLPSHQDPINMKKTVNKLIWEQIWLNLQDRQLISGKRKPNLMGKNEVSVSISFGVKRRRPSVSPLHILHFSVYSVLKSVDGYCQLEISWS